MSPITFSSRRYLRRPGLPTSPILGDLGRQGRVCFSPGTLSDLQHIKHGQLTVGPRTGQEARYETVQPHSPESHEATLLLLSRLIASTKAGLHPFLCIRRSSTALGKARDSNRDHPPPQNKRNPHPLCAWIWLRSVPAIGTIAIVASKVDLSTGKGWGSG